MIFDCENDSIEIALAADGGYFAGLFVTACSIAAYARSNVRLSFNILDGGISERDWQRLKIKVVELHRNSAFNQIVVDESLFINYPTWNGNRMAYARLLLPDALPDKDWVLYCDCDFLWMRDVTDLWNERDSHFDLISTPDLTPWAMQLERRWFEKNGFAFDENKYFCSGLCLFNLAKFREEALIRKCCEIMRIPGINFPDQAALNIVTWGKTKLLRKTDWQCFTHELTQENLKRGTVIHYAGELPWKFVRRIQVLSDTMLLWHKFYAMVNEISMMDSLKCYFGFWPIVWHRGLFVAFNITSFRFLAKGLLTLLGYNGAYKIFASRARHFSVDFDFSKTP